jgi:ATPase subunit of ABC transporter with duplicated ATPase domains
LAAPGAAAGRADELSRSGFDPLAAGFSGRATGTLITISHDRHFLNSVCTHIADIDYETIITYTGGYDDMVLAKTQIRSRIESAERAAREEDRAAERIHRALFGGHAVEPGDSRKKEVERLADDGSGAVEHSAAVIRFDMKRPSGKACAGDRRAHEGVRRRTVIKDFRPACIARREDWLIGRNGVGKTTLLKALLANAPGASETDVSIDSGTVKWGHEAQIGYFAQDTRRHREGHDGRTTGCTSSTKTRPRKTSAASWGRCCSRAKRA